MKKVVQKRNDIVSMDASASIVSDGLLGDLRHLIASAKSQVVQTANSVLVSLYWNVGKRIRTEILNNERATYGKEIVSALSRELSWTHFRHIIYIEDSLQRDFYAEMCRTERWSTRTLHANKELAVNPMTLAELLERFRSDKEILLSSLTELEISGRIEQIKSKFAIKCVEDSPR